MHERHSSIQAFSWVLVPTIVWSFVFWAYFIDVNDQFNAAVDTEKGCFIDGATMAQVAQPYPYSDV